MNRQWNEMSAANVSFVRTVLEPMAAARYISEDDDDDDYSDDEVPASSFWVIRVPAPYACGSTRSCGRRTRSWYGRIPSNKKSKAGVYR